MPANSGSNRKSTSENSVPRERGRKTTNEERVVRLQRVVVERRSARPPASAPGSSARTTCRAGRSRSPCRRPTAGRLLRPLGGLLLEQLVFTQRDARRLIRCRRAAPPPPSPAPPALPAPGSGSGESRREPVRPAGGAGSAARRRERALSRRGRLGQRRAGKRQRSQKDSVSCIANHEAPPPHRPAPASTGSTRACAAARRRLRRQPPPPRRRHRPAPPEPPRPESPWLEPSPLASFAPSVAASKTNVGLRVLAGAHAER